MGRGDGIDLSTPAGRLMAHVLASVAAYETEVRAERQAAGIAAARSRGKRWGGGRRGHRPHVAAARDQITQMDGAGASVRKICETLGVSRPTVYRILETLRERK